MHEIWTEDMKEKSFHIVSSLEAGTGYSDSSHT